MYQTDRSKHTIIIEGENYRADAFRENIILPFESKSECHKEVAIFLRDWFSNNSETVVHTSGTTGTPKEIKVSKEKMMNSALMTCSFLGLKDGDSALLCLPIKYIAGKMMVVRALVAGLNLFVIQPDGNPLKDDSTDNGFVFAAMIPLQVYNTLQNPKETERLKRIKNLIIGGGSIDEKLEKELVGFPNTIYSTYGMTETLSHIALRRLNGKDARDTYKVFNSINLSLAEDNSLIIDAPTVSDVCLYTNDIAEIKENGEFQILGRKDNVINSGGIKIQIEEVEKLMSPLLPIPFAVSSLPDEKFGEILVLVTEQEIDISLLKNKLPTYYVPKRIICLPAIPMTETGKINRKALKDLVQGMNDNK